MDVQQDILEIGQVARMDIEYGEDGEFDEVEVNEESSEQGPYMSMVRWEREMAYMNRRWDRIEKDERIKLLFLIPTWHIKQTTSLLVKCRGWVLAEVRIIRSHNHLNMKLFRSPIHFNIRHRLSQ